jgi:thymidylate synthase
MVENEFSGVYRELLKKLIYDAHHSLWITSRGRRYVERSNIAFVLKDPTTAVVACATRKQNKVFGALERLSYLSGHGADPTMLLHYNSQYAPFVNRYGIDDGAYGPRLMPQLVAVHNTLVNDRYTRRAVINVYDSHFDGHKLTHAEDNVPCTMFLQFMIREDALHLTAVMRSNDVLLGLTYDAEAFCFLQQVMARWLGIDIGSYTHFDVSLHLYAEDLDKAERIVADENSNALVVLPPWDGPVQVQRTFELLKLFWSLEARSRMATYTDEDTDVTGLRQAVGLSVESEYLSCVLKWVCDYNARKVGAK